MIVGEEHRRKVSTTEVVRDSFDQKPERPVSGRGGEVVELLLDKGTTLHLTNNISAMISGRDESWVRVEGRRFPAGLVCQVPRPDGLRAGEAVTHALWRDSFRRGGEICLHYHNNNFCFMLNKLQRTYCIRSISYADFRTHPKRIQTPGVIP